MQFTKAKKTKRKESEKGTEKRECVTMPQNKKK